MLYLIELLLFLLPFAAFWLWRRAYPTAEPSTAVLVVAGLAVAAGIGGAVWYGLSRSADQSAAAYVAPRWTGEGEEIVPGHAEPERAAVTPAARQRPEPQRRPLTHRADPVTPIAPEPR